jgi:phenylacetate-CoA ligase
MYWEKDIECMPREQITARQVNRLQETINCALKSEYYSKQLQGIFNHPGKIKSIEDLQKLPFTTKQDLRDHYPYGFLTVHQKEIIRLHSSSGTTGNPTAVFHNKHDLDAWANLVARCLYMVGARNTDVFQNASGYGLFTGGLGFQYGAERLGMLSIPAGAGNSKRQIKLMQDFGTSVVHAIPSYLTRLYEVFEEQGMDPRKDTDLRIFIIGAEPHTEAHRLRIEKLFGVKAYNCYGLSEMCGPGVAFECPNQNGLHIWEDSYIVEIINPDTLEPVEEGETGELVLTTLDRQAMPLIRYRTRDLTSFVKGDCPCGRTHRRIERFKGRSDDMFIIKGCNVFPMQVEKVIMNMPEVGHDYVIKLETIDGTDEIIIEVELNREWFSDNYAQLDNLTKKIIREIRDEILVTPRVKLVEPGSIPKPPGKAVRVKELRNLS